MCQVISGEHICTKSQHYNIPTFDNIAINMTQDENEKLLYFMDKGTCFGKVYNYLFLFNFLLYNYFLIIIIIYFNRF